MSEPERNIRALDYILKLLRKRKKYKPFRGADLTPVIQRLLLGGKLSWWR